ncbi:alpha tubulin suppressor [Kalmusia sp. IMI 367209]|nr:alpha tubulin suppressor [Kalmusia sp. IMI 367209]
MPYQLYVFGSNGEGQLGIPAADIVNIPTVAQSWPSHESIETVHGGDNHTLVHSSTGHVYFTGDNRKGQFGVKEGMADRIEGFETSELDVSFCAATCQSSAYFLKEHSRAPLKSTLVTDGAAFWGELGIGTISNTPGAADKMRVQTLPHRVIDFAAGGWHYVAILTNGEVWGWGKSRLDQLGLGLSSQQRILRPTVVDEDIPFQPVKVVCGKEFTYLVSEPALGKHHLLGRDKFSLRSSMPKHIPGWKQIGATWNAIFVLFEDGSMTAWGKNDMWKLLPENLPPIMQMAVGSEHVLAITTNGELISWGWGKHGNCGDLTKLRDKVKNDMVNGFWNDISIPGKIEFVGAGFCTSFVLTNV